MFGAERRSRTKTNLLHFIIEYFGQNKQRLENVRKIKSKIKQSPNTKERNQTLMQRTRKAGQRKNNHRKAKVTTKPKGTCLNQQKHNHQAKGKNHLIN